MYELETIPQSGTTGTQGQVNVSGGGAVGSFINKTAHTRTTRMEIITTPTCHSLENAAEASVDDIVTRNVNQ